MDKRKTTQFELGLSIVLILFSLFLIFQKFGAHGIYMWDEAIYANNALEMATHGNWWVIQNDGLPSHYNVKPPLVIWFQAISIQLFGVEEWAIRLPSLLAGVGIFIMLLFFGKKWTGKYLVGAIAIFILASCFGFNRNHVIRTADLDAINLFFTTGYTLIFLDFIWNGKPIKNFYTLLFIFVFGAFLSKSLAGFMPLFPLLIVSFTTKNGRKFLTKPKTWITIGVGFVLIMSYYYFRNLAQPEYFEMVWHSEILRFTHDVMEWHKHPFSFYFLNFWRYDYFFPHLFLFLIPIVCIFRSDETSKNGVLLLGATSFIFLIFISIPNVKLQWYDAHLYPLFAMFISLACFQFKSKRNEMIAIILVLGICGFASIHIIQSHDKVSATEPLEFAGEMIKILEQNHPEQKEYTVLMKVGTPEHLDQMKFYQKRLNWNNAYKIEWTDQLDTLVLGQKVLCCQNELLSLIKDRFKVNEIAHSRHCEYIQIVKEKK